MNLLRPGQTYATFQRNVLHGLGHPVATCCKMSDGVGNGQILLQHFWMLQDVAPVWPAPSQHLTQHDPTMLQDVGLKCRERLAEPLYVATSVKARLHRRFLSQQLNAIFAARSCNFKIARVNRSAISARF